MGYTFKCDRCGGHNDSAPPLMGELSESFIKTADSPLAEKYSPGQTVTICRECAEEVLIW